VVTTLRAALSAALLAGFYLLAFGIIGGLGWLAVWMWRTHAGAGAGKLSYLVLALAAGVVVALWKVVRSKPEPPEGVVLDERQAPELWATVRELAGVVQTRTPDEIRLVAEVNAAVTEDSRLLGLQTGRRYLYLGVPLLQALTVAQVRSVLAHELGHYSHGHTRLGELTYRGQAAIVQTINQVGPSSLTGRLFRLYARLYFLVSLAVSRRMELEADQASVRVAGRDAAAAALRELPVITAAWGFYLNNYVGWGLDSGSAPTGVLAGFDRLRAARGGELAKLRDEGHDERSWWDSHPPIATRIALIEQQPQLPGIGDGRPADTLVPGLDSLLDAVEQATFDFGERTRVSFDEYTSRAMQAGSQRDADVLYRASARVGGAGQGNLDAVLRLLESGRRDELMQALLRPAELADAEAAAAQFASLVDSAISVALVRAGAASWRHSWSEPAVLVGRHGQPVAVEELVRQALQGPDSVGRLRVHLRELGMDESKAVAEETAATATGADVVAGVSDLKVDGHLSDVLVADTGLIIVPSPGKRHSDKAKQRLYALATQASPQELAGRAGSRFLAYEDVLSARLAKRLPVAFEVNLRDGRTVMIKQTLNSEELGEGFAALGQVLGGMGQQQQRTAGAEPDGP
jgi:Zn-dependent protease with chaperone function